VEVTTHDGRHLAGRVDEPKGDPGNTLSRPELEAKALKLAAYRGGASGAEMQALIARIWALDTSAPVGQWFPA
jgi:2-methylcitrate dehydratase PrpD